MVCRGINHLAILPNGSVTEVYNGITVVVPFFTTETEQTGTSDAINRNIAANDIVARNVDDKLFWLVSVVGNVLNVQYLLGSATAYYRTIVEVNGKRFIGSVVVYIDNFALVGVSRSIERAMVECFCSGTIGPKSIGVVTFCTYKFGVSKNSRIIAPILRSAFDNTILDKSIVCMREAKIVLLVRDKKFHILECDAFRTLKAIITVILAALTRIHFRADTPKSFFGALTDESKSLFLHQLFPSILFFF